MKKAVAMVCAIFTGFVPLSSNIYSQSGQYDHATNINYVVSGLDETGFQKLFDLNELELAKLGAVKIIATSKPGYPCVISLDDAEIGEEIILLPYDHINSNSPFRSRGPVYVRNNVRKVLLENSVPENLKIRRLSVRVYDDKDMMVNARTIDGRELEKFIQEAFRNPEATYIQVHISSPGCFNCQIDRS